MNCMPDVAGMGWMMVAMGGAGILVLIALVLTIAALVKYLRNS